MILHSSRHRNGEPWQIASSWAAAGVNKVIDSCQDLTQLPTNHSCLQVQVHHLQLL
jgi:hypothetical protein